MSYGDKGKASPVQQRTDSTASNNRADRQDSLAPADEVKGFR
jgi:hypothetical protein